MSIKGLIYHYFSGSAAHSNEVETALLHGDSNLVVAGDGVELPTADVVKHYFASIGLDVQTVVSECVGMDSGCFNMGDGGCVADGDGGVGSGIIGAGHPVENNVSG